MQFNSFEELLIRELQYLNDAETQLIAAFSEIQNAASNPELKEVLKKHFAETKQEAKRLELALEKLQVSKTGSACIGMKGLISECKNIIKSQAPSLLKDVALIGGVQKIEHYEISCYGTARAYAKMLELDEIADLLEDSLKEEINTDKNLTKIAEGTFFTTGVNRQSIK